MLSDLFALHNYEVCVYLYICIVFPNSLMWRMSVAYAYICVPVLMMGGHYDKDGA